MSAADIFNEANHLSIQEKLTLIELLSRSVRHQVPQFAASEEALYSSSILSHDPSWNFLKDSAEDIYSLQHIKEKR